MIYDNATKITFRNNNIANEALEILKDRLSNGFACDTNYDDYPSNRLMNDLWIDGRTLVILRENGYYLPKDMEIVMLDLLKELAKKLNKSFTCENQNFSDDDFGEINATFKNGTLSVKSIYYPQGYSEYFYCENCGVTVVWFDEYESDRTYICPECGEVLDFSNQMPVKKEYSFKLLADQYQ